MSTEVKLNLIWLAVSLAIFVAWGSWRCGLVGTRLPFRQRGRCRVLFEILVLAGMAIVLFPNISMSDDDIGDLWVSEDKSISWLTIVAHCHAQLIHAYCSFWLLLLAICGSAIAFFNERARWWDFFVEAKEHFHLSLQNARPFRAPPIFSSI